jgi:PhnB protein
MTFYHECLGGKLELQEVAGSPMEADWKGEKDQIVHAELTLEGALLLMGSDMVDQIGYLKGTDIALAIGCSSEAEIQKLFERLSGGGKILTPLKDQFWDAMFGSCQDRFGLKWMLNYDKQNK